MASDRKRASYTRVDTRDHGAVLRQASRFLSNLLRWRLNPETRQGTGLEQGSDKHMRVVVQKESA